MSECFIHPNGTANLSDGDAGSLSNPFGTIQEGIDVAVNPGDIVSIIHDDTLGNPIHYISARLDCNNSGTSLSPIIIRGVDRYGVNKPYIVRAKIDVTISGVIHFYGTGKNINCTDLDLGNYNTTLFSGLSQWKVERVRQVEGSASGSSVFGTFVSDYCRHCMFIDCEQLISRSTAFNSEGNASGGNIYYRCYTKYNFYSGGERKTNHFIYCLAEDCTVGFNMRFDNYTTVGGSIYGCIALNCGTGFTFGSGGVVASKLTVIGSTGNGIELYNTGSYGGSLLLTDSIIMNSGGYGLAKIDSSHQYFTEERNVWYNNTSGNIQDGTIDISSLDSDPLINLETLQISTNSLARRKSFNILDYYSTNIDAGVIDSEDAGAFSPIPHTNSCILYENGQLNFYSNGTLIRGYK